MSALDYLLNSPDAFALFGLERTFDVDTNVLEQRYASLTSQSESFAQSDPSKVTELREKLDDGKRLLADPVTRGAALLELLAGRAEAKIEGYPAGFIDKLEEMKSTPPTPEEVQLERKGLLAQASQIFRSLAGSADNGVVQRERRRQVRGALNAVRELDALANG